MSYDDNTEHRLSAALQGMVGDRPWAPDLDQIESRGRTLRRRRIAWRATAGTGFAVAAVAAIAVATSGTGTQAPSPNLAAPNPATATSGATADSPLVQLVGYLAKAEPAKGDATLLLRDQVFDDGLKVDVWDLHADNGDYYFAKTKGALPAQVKNGHKQEDEAGRKKTVAAATEAATGDLNAARKDMAWAYVPKNPKVKPTLDDPGVVPPRPADAEILEKLKGGPFLQLNTTDNWVWNNSMDALRDGAGNPQVRAGVLRLLGQMPEVKVEKGTYQGRAVLNLTAGKPATTSAETLTVDAETGLPIKFAGDGVDINYTVTRVTLADVAHGKF
ncbi:hypothetical protein ACIA5D_04295 [Actinoplanes sp. NPDC051513]|uniref:hypothetical protein n=1 Tax=Actinoplanes sp. NPDC051513 TaxID=3363908 RepID=UPI00378EB4CA